MFKEFAINIIALAFLGAVLEMITPNGTMRKYFKLVMGFMMMLALISPIKKGADMGNFEFSFDAETSEEEIQAKSNAYILKLHEDNIVNYIKSYLGQDTEVFVEIFSDGNVKSVSIQGKYVSEEKLATIKSELGCENIKVIGGDNVEN